MAGLGDFILKTIGVADMSQVQEEVKKTTTNATNKITGMLSGCTEYDAKRCCKPLFAGMGIAISLCLAAAESSSKMILLQSRKQCLMWRAQKYSKNSR